MVASASTSAHPPTVEHLYRFADEYDVYGWANIDVILWKQSATGDGMRALHRVTQHRLASAGMTSIVHDVLPSAGLPSGEARQELARLAERFGGSFACIVSVIERDGFWGSALRGVTTGLYAITSRSTTHRVVATMAEAAAWIPGPHARATGVQVDPMALRLALETIRATCS